MSLTRVAAAALALVLLTGGAATADSRDHHYYHHVRHHRPPPPAWGYGQPSYVASPPPLVYAPPSGPAVLNFGITLPIR